MTSRSKWEITERIPSGNGACFGQTSQAQRRLPANFPDAYTHWVFAVENTYGVPVVALLSSWELDPGQPRLKQTEISLRHT